jgi:hypothetical protein
MTLQYVLLKLLAWWPWGCWAGMAGGVLTRDARYTIRHMTPCAGAVCKTESAAYPGSCWCGLYVKGELYQRGAEE